MKFKFNFLGLIFTSKAYLLALMTEDFKAKNPETYNYVVGLWDSCIFGVNIRKNKSYWKILIMDFKGKFKAKFGNKK